MSPTPPSAPDSDSDLPGFADLSSVEDLCIEENEASADEMEFRSEEEEKLARGLPDAPPDSESRRHLGEEALREVGGIPGTSSPGDASDDPYAAGTESVARGDGRMFPSPTAFPLGSDTEELPRIDWLTGVQARLRLLGYYLGRVDNVFGPRTKAAVKAFQADHDLLVDGIPGPKTQAKLLEVFGA